MPVRLFPAFFIAAFFILFARPTLGQAFAFLQTDGTQPICLELRQLAADGQKFALRDLGSLLADPVHGPCAREVLADLLLIFENEKAVLASKAAFLAFFYEKKERLWFDPLLAVWRDEPFSKLVFESKAETLPLPPPPDQRLKKTKKALADAHLLQKDTALALAVRDLAELRTTAADQAVLAFSKTISEKTPRPAIAAAASALRMQPTAETVELVLFWAKKGWINGDEAEYSMSTQLNQYLGTNVASVLADRWRFWRDSLGSLEAIRQAGFEGPLGTRPSFFADETDYWGHVLAKSGDLPWVRYNAIEKLARSENPRALLFLAALPFHFRQPMRFRAWSSIRSEAVFLLEKRTFLTISLPDSLGKMAFSKADDPVWAMHFFAFWAKNWPEMEFDPRLGGFRDRRKAATAAEEADRLFRRLSSSNDSVAMASYALLMESDPSLVASLAEQFRSFSRGFNPLLPSFKYRFLESLSQLTAFCRENGADWRPAEKAQFFLDRLDENPPPRERYAVENAAIKSLDLSDATALEVAAFLRQADIEFGFSVARVLYFLYEKSWPETVENDEKLRFFAKKSALFAQVGTVGACAEYEKRFIDRLHLIGDRAAFATRLAGLFEAESDGDVRLFYEKILAVLADEKAATAAESSFLSASWERFFDRPDAMPEAEKANLPRLTEAGEVLFFKKMRREKTAARLLPYLDWLLKNADPNMAIELASPLPSFEKMDSAQLLAERTASIFDRVFDARVPGTAAERLAFWQKKSKIWGKNAEKWFAGLLENDLAAVAATDSVRIEILQRIGRSPFFGPSARAAILNAVPKVRPAADLKRLASIVRFRSNELVFFENVALGHRDLDDLGRIFEADRPELLLRFFVEKSAGFGESNRAQFFNELMRQDWLRAFLSQLKTQTADVDLLRKSLENRIENEDLTEFEENATQANLIFLRGAGLPFAEKLAMLDALGLDDRGRSKLQREILATAAWADLPSLAQLFSRLAPTETGEPGHLFLTTDFGLPPLDWAEPSQNQEFVKIVSGQPPGSAHAFFLRKFGCDVFQSPESPALDLQKVRTILTFGGATAFTGGGGSRRDWTIFGVIKILEFEHGVALGFHEKLNENQTFYTFNASKRAAAWLRFLDTE